MLLYFFFQAEDGIRDLYVTGVQTCALPICFAGRNSSANTTRTMNAMVAGHSQIWSHAWPVPVTYRSTTLPDTLARSEERRVGKECRCRGLALRREKKRKKEWICRHVKRVGG